MVDGILSKEDISSLVFPKPFDLIWCGSLVTHLPENLFFDVFELMERSLATDGIALITLHGRYSAILNIRRRAELVKAYSDFFRGGFGYQNYGDMSRYNLQEQYGVSLSLPSYVIAQVERKLPSLRIISYLERAWDDHQDLVILQKKSPYEPGLHDRR